MSIATPVVESTSLAGRWPSSNSGSGFTVGVQSSATFEATGGKVSAPNAAIGGGHNNVTTSYVPGMGAHFQRGGHLDVAASLVVGQFLGSSGSMAIQRGSTVDSERFIVGRWGSGAVLQTDGTVAPLISFALGTTASGIGTYTIVDGALNPKPSGYHTDVGILDGVEGVGHLVIVGNRASIETAASYVQNSRSRLPWAAGTRLAPEDRDTWRLVLYQNKLNAFYCPPDDYSGSSGPCVQ